MYNTSSVSQLYHHIIYDVVDIYYVQCIYQNYLKTYKYNK
jgi:hypothetical protein